MRNGSINMSWRTFKFILRKGAVTQNFSVPKDAFEHILKMEPGAMEFKLSGVQSPLLVSGLPFSLSFTVSARVRGPLTSEGLKNALVRLCQRHPLLAVRAVAGKDGAAYFTTEGVPPIPLQIIERATEEDWVRQVEREIAQPADYRAGPPFRCVWLRGQPVSDLLLVCDHITADGHAGIYALRDLLTMLADSNRMLEPLVPASMTELIPPPMMEKIAALTSPAPGAAPRPPAEYHLPAPPVEILRVMPFALDEAETAALVSRCRAEGVTVQSALCAAFTLPFAERHPDAPVRKVESPVDIRGRLTQPLGEVYGNYISLAVTNLNCAAGRNPWDIAREARHALAAITEEQLFTAPVVVMAVAEQPLSIPPVDISHDLSISNLGRLDIPAHYGPFYLESIYGPTLNVSWPGHRILGVNTFSGRMRCTFTSRDPEAPQILQRARELLTSMVQP